MQTYVITDTGYEIYLKNKLIAACPWDPSKPGHVPFESLEDRLAHISRYFPKATERV